MPAVWLQPGFRDRGVEPFDRGLFRRVRPEVEQLRDSTLAEGLDAQVRCNARVDPGSSGRQRPSISTGNRMFQY
jgi:hypothetical protein